MGFINKKNGNCKECGDYARLRNGFCKSCKTEMAFLKQSLKQENLYIN